MGPDDAIFGLPPPRRDLTPSHKRYDVVKRATWTAGGMLKHLKGFGSQIDLSVCFVERSLQLLRPDGAMGLWLPSKLMRALYGGGVRRLLMTHAYPVSVSELDDRQFAGATTYPCAVVAVRGCPCPSPYQRVHVKAEAEERGRDIPLTRLRWDADDLASPWVLTPRGDRRGVLEYTRRVGQHPHVRVCRGVMTGLNKAFIVPKGELSHLPREYMVPLLRGGQVSAWRNRMKANPRRVSDDHVKTTAPHHLREVHVRHKPRGSAIALHLPNRRIQLGKLFRESLKRFHQLFRARRTTPPNTPAGSL
ncbi:MAG: hypothetical protein AAFX99_18305 [Myxococcota bacterium]